MPVDDNSRDNFFHLSHPPQRKKLNEGASPCFLMKVQAVFNFRGIDIEKTIKNIEYEGGVCHESLDTHGRSHYVIKLPTLKDVTIQLFSQTINVYYDDERYSIQHIQKYLRKLIVDNEGKLVELVLKKVNQEVRQKVKGLLDLYSGPLEMTSPSGIVVSQRVMLGTLTASVLPAGSSVREPLLPRNRTLGTCIGTLCIS